MAKQDYYGRTDLEHDFPTDEACLDYLFSLSHTKECACGGEYNPLFKTTIDKKGRVRLTGRKQYQCSKCRYQIAPMTDSIFEKSHLPLKQWFHAILIFSNAKSGISAKEMQRQLNVTYKTAYRVLKQIRDSIGQDTTPLRGNVEMDEAFFGGKGNGGKYNKNYSDVMASKAKVIAAIEREGDMRAKKVPNLTAKTIDGFLKDNVQIENTRLLTDESNRYDNASKEYHRESVNHSKKEYARGDIHINHVEWFWKHVKASLRGTYKSISQEQLQSYLDQFVWHWNNRGNDRLRFASLLSAVVKK
ncbi:MAG: hypothetical protein A2725_00965 [Candidatus Magasanikbacteria bacterium RIFCSPHIGHO2_01_FULL_33_34]|uniref:ISXO2-like transposase domain-containing protein n=1 Tax=Candidatus Magasanikbacteria bacterium RIFCSPHIGHO2_01_FULL_33_34 TaxID=1798671 RepID=A0A1F6LIZ6_9BACT|nr:MAG: hypothetical protein A2725_00965 [Candidatus Magasanikbacteria bacterium RIFCSPHIGHO2_01_FULL_33_34]OGH65326.1 MAG: hypothetical protein A3B83_04625 [Candidatus Magasanikbacteria bacterium RIFCSPHIGHO2_02_FULL_33_17]OGH76102.1 MAG: hypothetical protein A3A89_01545 [Candidatus Magasanikbacteria bacterium RIFCSPLOWO2_01_FULL_33_34]OGH82073.1 MAG: hypothetical protein A3F93_04290 [Candidatus Magasanikbacteria bacterium RIFCSPLOWO2_12_FULL_34_7]